MAQMNSREGTTSGGSLMNPGFVDQHIKLPEFLWVLQQGVPVWSRACHTMYTHVYCGYMSGIVKQAEQACRGDPHITVWTWGVDV